MVSAYTFVNAFNSPICAQTRSPIQNRELRSICLVSDIGLYTYTCMLHNSVIATFSAIPHWALSGDWQTLGYSYVCENILLETWESFYISYNFATLRYSECSLIKNKDPCILHIQYHYDYQQVWYWKCLIQKFQPPVSFLCGGKM